MTGVILAAGYGSRFLPASKSVPKELFPVLNQSALDFIVKEFIDAGITRIFVISNRRKHAVEDYFDRDVELEQVFAGSDKASQLPGFSEIPVAFIRQAKMQGTGHALLSLKPFIGEDPFIVAYPDDLVAGENLSQKLIQAYNSTQTSVLSCVEVPMEEAHRYGVVALGDQLASGITHVTGFVEKPPKDQVPSNMASIGRYLYSPEFLPALEAHWQKFSGSGEFYHVDALKDLAAMKKLTTVMVSGRRFDIGSIDGYLKFIINVAKDRGLDQYIRSEL